jgi:hypothetical protein
MKDLDFEIKVRLTKEFAKHADPFEVLEAVTMVGRVKYSATCYQRHRVLELVDDETGNEDDY